MLNMFRIVLLFNSRSTGGVASGKNVNNREQFNIVTIVLIKVREKGSF